ncbi:hypothetical protein JG687_00015521 [Phytophthora cactorum]|uniref:Uncharacterized protein n=1 Tax=Phytophthora cactorum TaxID=29920 RepID=A0A8T1TVQ9_9STRA|nr:hypothetical protein JG687_00015521 [Phytophthora cactorum]
MKGTRVSPNDRCVPFELSHKDGALHWHKQLPTKTKNTTILFAKRGDKEHVCGYLSRLNDYARSTGIKFENGGRKAPDHVKQFLETFKRDDHDILKIEERTPPREPAKSISRSRDKFRCREERRREDSRRRRDDSRNLPRATLAELAGGDVYVESRAQEIRDIRSSRASSRLQRYEDSGDESGYGSEASKYSSEDQDDNYSFDGGDRYLAAANDNGRRITTKGTCARSENRPQRADGTECGCEREGCYPRQPNRDDRYQSRNNRDGRHQYGPYAATATERGEVGDGGNKDELVTWTAI